MRVCLVSSSFYPAIVYGGPISATWDLSKKLGDKGIQVYVATTNANGKERLKEVNTHSYNRIYKNVFVRYYHEQIINFFSLSFLFGIFSDIRKSEVVYIQYLFHYTVVISLFIASILGKRIIICPRGSFSDFTLSNRKSWFKRLWLNIFIQPFKSRITWHASSFLEKSDIFSIFPGCRVSIISDGIDFDAFQDVKMIDRVCLVERYTNIKFQEVSEVIFSMGRLHRIKCFNVLIDAFSLFVEDHNNAKLLIAGTDNGMKDILDVQIRDLNLSDSVFLIGSVGFEDKKLLLSNCSVFALASEFESFGIVVAEALACGTPVIVSNKTPWKDLEEDNCGILADNNKISFHNAFNDFLSLEFNKISIKNHVRLNYDWGVIVGSFLRLIKN